MTGHATPFQMIKLQFGTNQGRTAGYRINKDQSGGNKTILQPVSRWRGRPMSVVGRTRSFGDVGSMSGLPPPTLSERLHRRLACRLVAVTSGCGLRDGREHLIGSASTAIERFANGIRNDASPSAALTAANEIPGCIVVCERHGAYLSRSTI